MIHFIDLRGKDINDPEDWKEEIAAIAADFDVDEEIDIHRQDKRYCDAFTCRASVYDFEAQQNGFAALPRRFCTLKSKRRMHDEQNAKVLSEVWHLRRTV